MCVCLYMCVCMCVLGIGSKDLECWNAPAFVALSVFMHKCEICKMPVVLSSFLCLSVV